MSSSLRFFSLAAWVTAVTAGVACGISADQIGDGNGGFASAVSSSTTGSSTVTTFASVTGTTTTSTSTTTTVTTTTTSSTHASTTSAGGAGGEGGAMGGGGIGGAAEGGGGAGQGGALNGGGGAGTGGAGGKGAGGGPGCGNGALDSGEECDDHNTAPGDGCDKQCKLEQKDSAGRCATTGPTIHLGVGTTVWIAGDTNSSGQNQFSSTCGGFVAPELYYRVTTIGQGQLTATVYPNFQAVLDIFKDCGTELTCTNVGAANSGSVVAAPVTTGGPGATVNQLVVVDGDMGGKGTFDLELSFN